MTEQQTDFIAANMPTMLSISNNRNLINADFVLFTLYDSGGIHFLYMKDEQEVELLKHRRGKRCDIKEEVLFSIPKLAMYLFEQEKVLQN